MAASSSGIPMRSTARVAVVVTTCLLAGLASPAFAQVRPGVDLDAVFGSLSPAGPGCAAGVAVAGSPALTGAYGQADLEHPEPLTPATVFESGSVAKQFTAAAVLLLVQDGKLSLDDVIRL
jgi:CubicO group peptidase (beta-lactamase class C family)